MPDALSDTRQPDVIRRVRTATGWRTGGTARRLTLEPNLTTRFARLTLSSFRIAKSLTATDCEWRGI